MHLHCETLNPLLKEAPGTDFMNHIKKLVLF